ncbi:MAG: alpha/beta hydrolase [Pseudomonadota bacterium]
MRQSVTVPRGRLRFAFAGYVLKLLSLLPAQLRRKMLRTHVDAPIPAFPDYFQVLRLCDPSVHFGWAAVPGAVQQEFARLAAVEVVDLSIETTAAIVPMRLYRDPALPASAALLWIHGGGFTGGGLDCAEAHWVALELAAQGIPVLTMTYRKALDGVTFPAPSDDVLKAWDWAVAHADRLGVRPEQIHIGGGSAGGNLSAGVTKRLRDQGRQLPASLVMVYPLLHSALPKLAPDDEAFCKSRVKAFADADFVLAVCLNYVGDPAALADPYAFPGLGSLHGLPPVLIVNAQFDSLRGSGEAFAARLAADGGTVSCQCETGALHGYLMMPSSPFAHATIARMLGWLKDADRTPAGAPSSKGIPGID